MHGAIDGTPPFSAEQGYIVIMPNITGAIGFGQKFIKDIGGEWGGRQLLRVRP